MQTDSAILAFSGTWQVTVTDAHFCSTSDTVFIGNDGLVERSLSAEICAGTTYTISGQSFSAPGSYTFNTVGTTGCDTLTHLTINVLDPELLLTVLPESIEITCAAPEITLCAPALPTATFQWLKNGIPVSADPCLLVTAGGTYVLQFATSGCTATKSIAAIEHLTPAPAQISGEFIFFCNGIQPGWLLAHTIAENPAYAWVYNGLVISTTDSCFFQISEFQGGDPILPTLSITDQYGCVNSMAVQNIIFTQYPAMSVQMGSIVPASSSTANDGAINISIVGGIPPYAIDWSTGAATLSITDIPPGTYCVTVTDSHGCHATTCATVLFPMAVNALTSLPLRISPNPVAAGQWIQISLPEAMPGEPFALELIDFQGRLYTQEGLAAPNNAAINVKIPAELNPGVLLLRLRYKGAALLGLVLVQ